MDERSLRLRMEYFLSGEAGRTARRSAARDPRADSPFGGCRPVRGQTEGRSLSRRRERDEPDAAYDEVFQRVEGTLRSARAQVAREHQAAGPQWERLKAQAPGRRMVMVRNDKRLQAWGLFDRLLDECRRIAGAHPQTATELAQLALAVAERLPLDVYGVERVADFRCAALIELANARRRGGNLAGARLALAQAQIHLEFGTGDLLDQANLSHRLFELHRDEGDLEEALQQLERAKALYRLLGDDRLRGVTLLPYPAAPTSGVRARSGRGGHAPGA